MDVVVHKSQQRTQPQKKPQPPLGPISKLSKSKQEKTRTFQYLDKMAQQNRLLDERRLLLRNKVHGSGY